MGIKSIRFKSGRQALVWGSEPTQQALINLHSYNVKHQRRGGEAEGKSEPANQSSAS